MLSNWVRSRSPSSSDQSMARPARSSARARGLAAPTMRRLSPDIGDLRVPGGTDAPPPARGLAVSTDTAGSANATWRGGGYRPNPTGPRGSSSRSSSRFSITQDSSRSLGMTPTASQPSSPAVFRSIRPYWLSSEGKATTRYSHRRWRVVGTAGTLRRESTATSLPLPWLLEPDGFPEGITVGVVADEGGIEDVCQ